MKSVNLLIKNVKLYNHNEDEINLIKFAYEYAKKAHGNQKRQSGEPYITHPLAVATILSSLYADTNTIIAALLHDVLEDTEVSKEELIGSFGEYVVKLVDGVTKMNKANFSSKAEADAYNTRKLLNGITKDVRILYIKLADRLHNMRTLQFKSSEKQKIIARETISLYIPLAAYLGCHSIKHELELLCFKYSKPKTYLKYSNKEKLFLLNNESVINDTISVVKKELRKNKIKANIYYRYKNIYELYEQYRNLSKKEQIHDLVAIKVNVDSIEECYRVLGLIHKHFKPFNSKFKDYIVQPKNNMYRSLHTTVFVDRQLFQFQIRTHNMDRVACFGLTAYWLDNEVDMNDVIKRFNFFKDLVSINQTYEKNKDFIASVKSDILTSNVSVYTPNGEVITLPTGSTAIDFAYAIHTDLGDYLSAVLINGFFSKPDVPLNQYDVVTIITDKKISLTADWLEKCKTTKAKNRILKILNNNL